MGKHRIILGTAFLALTSGAIVHRLGAVNGGWTLLAWNNLGMHCMDSDYSVFSILPPYNTVQAQLIDRNGVLVKNPQGYTVTYEAVADPSGSTNATSANKTNFWSATLALFGISLPIDAGLAGHGMPGSGNVPQAMIWSASGNLFIAEGIPIVPYDDSGEKNYYPMMHLVARDQNNNILAATDIVLPVSDEMDCRSCHASDSSPAARPAGGWAHDPDPEHDYRLNILLRHDQRTSSVPGYPLILATAGYDPKGLYATVSNAGKPVLCASCHASNALGTTGIGLTRSLTQSVHAMHASVTDPTNGLLLDSSTNRTACYRCHPGSETRCLRGVMGSSVAPDGSLAIQCQSCHGNMSAVGAQGRQGWLDEPQCGNCHTGTAVQNSGQIRYLTAFTGSGARRVPANTTFATNPNTPGTGLSLYRFSSGHGGLQCEACHGSTHAEYPSIHPSDNIQSLQAQGHVGMTADCTACHAALPSTITGGPHGMHPIGQQWAGNHDSAVESGGRAQCQLCHGVDYRGTELSRALGARNFSTRFGIKQFWRGFQIGCYACHNGPSSESANSNLAPVVTNTAAKTASGTPVNIPLAASDSNNNPLSLRIVTQPSHGTVALANSLATFIPNPGYAGPDTFTFAAWDGSVNSNLATVSLSVASQFFIPYYLADANSFTGIAVSNYSAYGANVQLTAFGPDGGPLTFPNNPATLYLAPQSQLAKLGSEIFGVPTSVPQAGWIQVSGDIAELGALFQFGDFGSSQLDGSVALTQTSRQLRFTRILEGPAAFLGQAASTFLSIANPNSGPITISLNLLGSQPGQVLASAQSVTIASRGVLVGTVSQIFGSSLKVSSGSVLVQVLAGDGAVGFEMIRFPDAQTVVGLNASTGNAVNQSYSAQLAISSSNFTNIKMINTSPMARTATLHVLDENGTDLTAAVPITLAPGQAFEQDAQLVFGLTSAVGSLRVDADGPGLIGDVLFGDPITLAYAASAPLQAQKFSQAVFSQVANGANLWTGLALLNPNQRAASITLDVFTEAGIKSGSNTITLGPGQRLSRLLTESTMVPSSAGQMRGYILLHSTLPIIGQEMFGDTRMARFLSAVPPSIIN